MNSKLLFTGVIGITACTGSMAENTNAEATKPEQEAKRPNIVFVFADQMRADVLGYAGDTQAITPNIDRFAGQAMNFTEAVSVSPVSAPYRSSLLTGKYISSTGMIINEINLNLNHDFLAEVLTENGYNCGYIGKMHLNDAYRRPNKKGPERYGFDDYWAGYTFWHESYKAFYTTDTEEEDNVMVDISGKYGPEEFTTLACNYMERASKEEKPFAMFLSWNPPHDPWVERNTDPACYARFKDAKFSLPENFKATPDPYMDRYPGAYLNGKESWKDEFINGGGYQETLRCYYAMNNSIDEQFGRIMAKIQELGIDDNTIVVFTSDHGEMFTSQGRMYKLTFYNEAARVPMLVRMPGGKTGTSDVLINTPDIMPTLLGMAGLGDKIPAAVEGDDLSFVVKGGKGKEPEFALMQGMGHTHLWRDGFEWRAIRDHNYLYARYLRDGKEVFFDLNKDPMQMNDVSEEPNYASVLAQYRTKMAGKLASIKDEFKPCTWYRDNWMYKKFSVKAAAQGEFGPLPPVEPQRGQN